MKINYFRLLATCFSIFCYSTFYVNAASFTVINTNDTGAGSLRDAINSASSNPMDADNIVFNIPLTDPNFDVNTGVFTISLNTLLPTINSISVTIDGSTQSANQGNTNPNGPEILIRSSTNLMYCFAFPLSGGRVNEVTLNGFMYAISITKYLTYPSGNTTVENCYLGVNHDGTAMASNEVGIAILEANSNVLRNNLISGNTLSGIALRKSNNNTIYGNRIGTNALITSAIPNYYGIAVDSSSNNTIGGNTVAQRNIISGNEDAGVAINSILSSGNVVKGNYIGINTIGNSINDTIPNLYGVAINDSPNNTIGGSTVSERNIISGNSDVGIAIQGITATNNVIKGNYIGTNSAGNDSIPNLNGIVINGSPSNKIGGGVVGDGNVISGNTATGIAITYSGARLNTVKGNFIGTIHDGTAPLGNHTGIYVKSNANKNTFGGTTPGERNIISGNIEMGLITEAADSNVIIGNFIGPDVTGMLAFKYSNDTLIQGNGLMFNTGSKYNIAGGYTAGERNIISGNRIYGHDIYGNSSYNSTIGNYIGVDVTGNNPLPNATGICVDGGSNHNPFINNVLSGNYAYGMFIVTTGSDYNELKGNKIGTNAAGTVAVPNQIGFLLSGGTRHNTIGGTILNDRNIISGNIFSGIEMADAGTNFNTIIGNYIGTDITGLSAIPNMHGIGTTTNVSKNSFENNVISGNQKIGILLYEFSDSNTVYSNLIGLASDGVSSLPNHSSGIVISNNSSYNQIGTEGKGNTIAFSDTAGVIVMDNNSRFNTLSSNLIYNNLLMDIDIEPFGVNVNDLGDDDLGSNEQMNYPVIQSATYNPTNGSCFITGKLDCNSYGGPQGDRVEIFKTDNLNQFGHGGAVEYLGYANVSNSAGDWTFLGTGISSGGTITATATDSKGNTSEYSANFGFTVSVENKDALADFKLYPNPAKDQVTLSFSVNKQEQITVRLLSIEGKQVSLLEDASYVTGNHVQVYDLNNFTSGMYLVEIVTKNEVISRTKLIVTK